MVVYLLEFYIAIINSIKGGLKMIFKLKKKTALVLSLTMTLSALLCTNAMAAENLQTESIKTTNLKTSANEWNADTNIPSWITLSGYTSEKNDATHNVFTSTDSNISSLTKRYTGAANSTISISLSQASTIKIYIAAANGSDGKGTANSSFNSLPLSTYNLPGRKTSSALPYEIVTSSAGTLTITNSYKAYLYKIEITEGGGIDIPKPKYNVDVKITNPLAESTILTIGSENIEVSGNAVAEKTLSLANGTYSISSSTKTLKANPSSITVNGDTLTPIELVIEECDFPIIVTDNQGAYINGFNTIKSAVESSDVTDNTVLSVKPGYYNENFVITKSITLQKMDNTEGEVVIYGNRSGVTNMDPVIQLNAPNIYLDNLTIINNYNSSYKDIVQSASTGCEQAAALEVYKNCNGCKINNCKIISVQDSLVTAHNKDNKAPYSIELNNCEIYGSTDFVCGAGTINFNTCDFVIYTGDAKNRTTSYIFAPSGYAQWSVNGGTFKRDSNSTIVKQYYARAWESASSDTQTIDIYGVKNEIESTIDSDGIMGFCGTTGGGRSHSITAYQFNMYDGTDKNSNLIATSYITGVDIFEMNTSNPIINIGNDGTTKLLIGDFGSDFCQKFIENVLPDIIEVGFVSEANASSDKITENNTIRTTTLYKTISSSDGSIPTITAASDAYIGAGILEEITESKTISVVPYVKYDSSYANDSENLDVNPVYKFGTPVTLQITNN